MEISPELIQQKMEEALPKIIEEIFSSSYNSPLRKVVDAALVEQEGAIKVLVNDVLSSALNDPTFKEKLGQAVLTKLVEKGLKN